MFHFIPICIYFLKQEYKIIIADDQFLWSIKSCKFFVFHINYRCADPTGDKLLIPLSNVFYYYKLDLSIFVVPVEIKLHLNHVKWYPITKLRIPYCQNNSWYFFYNLYYKFSILFWLYFCFIMLRFTSDFLLQNFITFKV